MADNETYDFTGLKALFINCTLKKSPALSHTDGLIEASAALMRRQGVQTEVFRSIDYAIASGVSPDMREEGWAEDAWPELFKEHVLPADILVLAGPIWLGDNSSEMKKIIERLYAMSAETNERGQHLYYGRVGGAIITGNEDGLKHCSSNILYSLQHIGYTIPPQADCGWLGEVGPGPSYMDKGSGGPENDFTNKNTTTMTWNLMHMAKLLKDNRGLPAWGNVPEKWQAGERFGYEPPAPAG